MSVFKRPEVWVLLVLAIVGVGYVLTTGGGGGDEDGGGGGASEGGKLRVDKVVLERDYGNARLDITVRYDNRGGGEFQVARPAVALVRGDGAEVDEFFLAGDFPEPVTAGREVEVLLKFWLKPEDLGGELTLRVQGDEAVVKGAGAFDRESVENQASVELKAGAW